MSPTAPPDVTAVKASAQAEPASVHAKSDVTRRATSGALVLVLRGLATRGVGFVSNAVLARLLLPRDFGVIAFGLTIMTFGSFLVDSGIGAALIRGDNEPDTETLSTVLGFELFVTVTLACAFLALGVLFGRVVTIGAVMTCGLSVTALRVPATVLLERRLEYGLLALADVSDTMSFSLISISLVVAGFGVWGIAIATATQGLVGTSLLLLRGPWRLRAPTLRFARIRRLLAFGIQYQAVGLLGLIRDEGTNIGVVIVSSFGTLGILTLAERLVLPLTLLFDSLWRVSYPAMAELRRLGSDQGAPLDKMGRYSGVGAAVIVVGAASVVPTLLPAVFGAKWRDVLVVLPGMLAGLLVVGPVSIPCGGYLYSEGRAGTVLRSAVAHTSLAWAALPLLPIFGLPVISYASFAVCAVEAGILGRATFQLSGWNAGRALARIWLAGGIAGISGWAAASTVGHSVLADVAIFGLAEMMVLAALVVLERPTVFGFASLLRTRLRQFTAQRGQVAAIS